MNRFGGHLKEIALANLQKTVLVATHGGTIGALLRYLEWPLDDQQTLGVFIGNSSYVKLKSDGTNFFVEEVVDI